MTIGKHVEVPLEEFIEQVAGNVAAKIVSRIIETEVNPLKGRVSLLEKTKTKYGAQLDLLWKVGVVVGAIVQVYHFLR